MARWVRFFPESLGLSNVNQEVFLLCGCQMHEPKQRAAGFKGALLLDLLANNKTMLSRCAVFQASRMRSLEARRSVVATSPSMQSSCSELLRFRTWVDPAI